MTKTNKTTSLILAALFVPTLYWFYWIVVGFFSTTVSFGWLFQIDLPAQITIYLIEVLVQLGPGIAFGLLFGSVVGFRPVLLAFLAGVCCLLITILGYLGNLLPAHLLSYSIMILLVTTFAYAGSELTKVIQAPSPVPLSKNTL